MSWQQAASSKQLPDALRLDQAIEHSGDFLDPRLEQISVELPPDWRAVNPVLGLEQGPTSNNEESPLIGHASSPERLGDIGPDRVDCSHELNSGCPSIERGPADDEPMHLVREFNCLPIGREVSIPTTHIRIRRDAIELRPPACCLLPADA
jgi:hypothetical protein